MVAVDGLTGFKSAAGEELLGRLWTPVALAGNKADQ